MNRFTKIALAGALLIAPTSAFAFDGNGDEGAAYEKHAATFQNRVDFTSYSAGLRGNGDEGAFFERRRPSFDRRGGAVSIVAGSFAEKRRVVVGKPGRIFNRADLNNDGVLNAVEQRRYKRLVRESSEN